MKPKVYIDGKEGTTGLQIYERLSARSDIDLLLIDEAKRKEPTERKKLMNAADLVFLCLPDKAAEEAVELVENPATRIIDASTATAPPPAGYTASRSWAPRKKAPSSTRGGWRIPDAMQLDFYPSPHRWSSWVSCLRTIR